jgi:hypothetical protein
MTEHSENFQEFGKDQLDTDLTNQESTKFLTEFIDMKKVDKVIEFDPKRRVNIGKLIKSVSNCYECKVSKFGLNEACFSEDDTFDHDSEQDYYEIDVFSKTNKIIITDKRTNNKHELDLLSFRNFLENKLEVVHEDQSDNDTTITPESKEDQKFHFLKFELILREFYQKNEMRSKLKANYNTNEVKKVDLGFSYVKQPSRANTYQGKNLNCFSPVIRKNFFEDHKEEIKKIDQKRRKTMFVENNMFDKLKYDLVENKVSHSQIPKFVVNFETVKEDKVSSFTSNVEESKDIKDSSYKNSLKIGKRTSIFDAKLASLIVNEELSEEECSNRSKD